MEREKAVKILKENLQHENLFKHSLAVEAVMRRLAKFFKQEEDDWALAGLLHDIDYQKVKDDMSQHSLLGAKMLRELGLKEDICQAVKVHNRFHGIEPQSLMEKSLFVADPLTGLIVASALVLPSRKIADLTVENVLNRFKEKSFAKGADRETIGNCQDFLNISLEDFVGIGLTAMQEIARELGLD
jgi:uncharacterized protein